MSAGRVLAVLCDAIGLASTPYLVVVLDSIALELAARMHSDARNHVLRATACLRADLAELHARSATTERPESW